MRHELEEIYKVTGEPLLMIILALLCVVLPAILFMGGL